MKVLKGLLSLLLCLCLIMPMGSALVAISDGGGADVGKLSVASAADPGEAAPSEVDYSELYAALMAAETFAEAQALLAGLSDEQLEAFIESLTEEQYIALEAHINELIAAAEDNGDIEYVYQTVNFTNVAPLLDPVSGSSSFGASLFGGDAESSGDEGGGTGTDGMVMLKNAVNNGDGTYTITLEAYATGAQILTEITNDVPTDIILVLDQSGSMAEDIGTVTFALYEDEAGWGTTYHTRNQDYYEYRHNGGSKNLWHRLSDDSYVSVSVTKQESVSYTQLSNQTTNATYYNSGSLYERVGDNYQPVTVAWSYSGNRIIYTYTFSDGTSVTSQGWSTVPDLGAHAPLYTGTVDGTQTVYTYSYTDANGQTVVFGSSIGDETVFSPTLYKRSVSSSGGGSRLAAIKAAVQAFTESVAAKAKGADGQLGTDDDVNHRIAIVGFASEPKTSGSDSYDDNTELLSIAGTNSNFGDNSSDTVGIRYNKITPQNYVDVLQSMNTSEGQTMVSNAINALAANGGTYVNYGLTMANNILNANPVNETRNRVVIVFTDGAPGSQGDWSSNSRDTANSALDAAHTTKNTYNATVYTVGIFSGADGSEPASLPSYNTGNSLSDAQKTNNSNRFMHLLSSNYPDATAMNTPGTVNPNLNGKSYYLSAGDREALNNIFEQISQQIETGGTEVTLNADSVIRDVVAQAFELPPLQEGQEDNRITLTTYDCIDGDGNGNYTWSPAENPSGLEASIITENGIQRVDVTGFDFSGNWVGTETDSSGVTYRGQKLVISFDVVPKDSFLGGNDVFTNDYAKIYPNRDDAASDVNGIAFNRPTVNVPIESVSVTPQDKNVYLFGGLTAAQLKNGATATCGSVILDLSDSNEVVNYGLEEWQNEYVNVTVTIKDADGNVISGFTNLDEDTTYILSVTVSPKSDGIESFESGGGDPASEQQADSELATINVFKPVLTFRDSDVWYGDTFAEDYDTYNKVSEVWMHGETIDSAVNMIGDKPVLTLTYDTPANAIVSGYVAAPDDIKVNVTVKLGENDITGFVTFNHQHCFEGEILPAGYEFLLHVQTCSLTISKSITGGGEPHDTDQSFIFTVRYLGLSVGGSEIIPEYTYEVVIQGAGSRTIVGLPVGVYTVAENSDWSWRYELDEDVVQPGDVELTASESGSHGEVTFTNKLITDSNWLGDEYSAANVFNSNGSENQPTVEMNAILPGKEEIVDGE